jgi:hypothetical protein
MNRYEWITSMSKEELAEYLTAIIGITGNKITDAEYIDDTWQEKEWGKEAIEENLQWLSEEYEEVIL